MFFDIFLYHVQLSLNSCILVRSLMSCIIRLSTVRTYKSVRASFEEVKWKADCEEEEGREKETEGLETLGADSAPLFL